MKKFSAGILVYRKKGALLEVLIAHHGGPFWAKKDNGAWSIIKGECDGSEEPFDAAKREFKEETSHDAPQGKYIRDGMAAKIRHNPKISGK
jgi:predicted NUDIX family NTP pyrophosphohydrolase